MAFTRLASPSRGVSAVGVALIALAVTTHLGCERDVIPFNRIEEGRKFLDAGRPIQAAKLFEESLGSEEETRSVARSLLLVSYHLALSEVEDIAPERAKYAALRERALAPVRDDPAALQTLTGMLSRHDTAAYGAAALLEEMGADAAPAVVEAYEARPMDRVRLLDILTRMGSAAAPALRGAVEEHDLVAAEQVALVRLLGLVDTPDAHSCLVGLRDGAYAPGVRAEASAALYCTGKRDERDYLIGALDSAFVLERTAAAYAMARDGSFDAVVLIAHLADPSRDVRRHLAQALGSAHGEPSAVAALVRVVREDEQDDVADAAIKALGGHGAAIIDPVLTAVEAEQEWTRRQRLLTALTHAAVRAGFDQDQEFRLYQRHQDPDEHPEVKWIIGRVLKDLEGG